MFDTVMTSLEGPVVANLRFGTTGSQTGSGSRKHPGPGSVSVSLQLSVSAQYLTGRQNQPRDTRFLPRVFPTLPSTMLFVNMSTIILYLCVLIEIPRPRHSMSVIYAYIGAVSWVNVMHIWHTWSVGDNMYYILYYRHIIVVL